MTLNTFCSHCGLKFAEQKLYPRKCFSCGNDTYRNPIPVAVGIIPVEIADTIGIVILQRGNEPSKGEWALPGGYIEYGETWQDGLAREIKEELGWDLDAEFHIQGVENSTGNNLILFGQCKPFGNLPEFIPNEEALAVRLYTDINEELAFPTHTAYARRALTSLIAFYSGSFV